MYPALWSHQILLLLLLLLHLSISPYEHSTLAIMHEAHACMLLHPEETLIKKRAPKCYVGQHVTNNHLSSKKNLAILSAHEQEQPKISRDTEGVSLHNNVTQ